MGVLDDAIREHLELKRRHGAAEEDLRRQAEEALGPARREVAPANTDDGNGTGEQAPADVEAAQAAHAEEDELAKAGPDDGRADEPELSETLPASAVRSDAPAQEEAALYELPPEEVDPEALHDKRLDDESSVARLRDERLDDESSAAGLHEERLDEESSVPGLRDEPVDDEPPAAQLHDESLRDEPSAAAPLAEPFTDEPPAASHQDEPFPEEAPSRGPAGVELDEGELDEGELDEDELGQRDREEGEHRRGGDTPPHGFEAVEDDELLDEAEEPSGEDADVLEDTPDFLQETPEHDRLWFEQKPPRDFDFD